LERGALCALRPGLADGMMGYEPIGWVFYQRHSAIERGTRPDAKGCKPCHWTNTLKATLVHTSRVWT
jgi:hypothetical protein